MEVFECREQHYIIDEINHMGRIFIYASCDVSLRKGQKNVQVPSRPFGDPSRPYALEGGMYVCL